MTSSKLAKPHLTEFEAAHALGLTIEQLRTLVKKHIAEREEDIANLPTTTFQPSDLVMLRLLANLSPSA